MNTITIRKRLASDVIKLGQKAKAMLGKNVEIIIREVPSTSPAKKHWRRLGAVDLEGKVDNMNIRDLAHDE